MFQHVLEHQPTVYKSKRSTATMTVNVSADMDDNSDDEQLLNQALDDAEQLFCANDDDELVRLANALDSDHQQQQQTTTIPRQYLLQFQ